MRPGSMRSPSSGWRAASGPAFSSTRGSTLRLSPGGMCQTTNSAAVGEARADRGAHLVYRQTDVEVEERLAVHLGAAQPPQVLGLRVPHRHVEVLVHHDGARAHAAEHRLEEGVEANHLVGALAQLL